MENQTRKQRREAARAERRAHEAAAARAAQRRRRLRTLGVAAVVAAAIVGVMAAISAGGADRDQPNRIEGGAEIARILDGIPQDGITLGNPRARVTLVEFADLQCPYCAQAANDALPAVIDRYVRTGRVKIEFQPLAFIGSDSQTAAQYAAAAAQQDRLWQFVELFYRNQGEENSGYVTQDYLDRLIRASGIDAARLTAARGGGQAEEILTNAQQLADAGGISSTPTFQLRAGDGRPQTLELTEYTSDQLIQPIERALGGR
jgi:protein-disulfide isomerase